MKLINFIIKTELSIMENVYFIYHCTAAYTGLIVLQPGFPVTFEICSKN